MRKPYATLGLLAVVAVGCAREAPRGTPIREELRVRVVRPQTRDFRLQVGQPGVIEAYEQTALYAKVAGYVEKWNFDIGDRVKKGDVLAVLSVPELVEQHREKQAQVELDKVQVEQAEKLVAVADGTLKAATADVAEAQAAIARAQADVDRWDSEVKRLTKLAAQKVVDQQVLDETQKQLKASTAARDEARAAVVAREARRVAAAAALEKARVDVAAARAQVAVAQAAERRLAALVGYTQITAPFDGIVVVRNTNTGDFVLPAGGDASGNLGSVDPAARRAAPLFTVARTDLVRVMVTVPEADAVYVAKGTKATVRLPSLGEEIPAVVTRTSWALNVKSRTLTAEIDLPNTGGRLLPGMYAYGSVTIARPGARALPLSAVTEIGNQTCCYVVTDGKAVRTRIETGVNDGSFIEVTRKWVESDGKNGWVPLAGDEAVVNGRLDALTDGATVVVEQ